MTMPLHSRRTAKPCQFRTPPRSSSPRCSLALVTNSSHSSLPVFRDLRIVSFFGSQLSRVLSPDISHFLALSAARRVATRLPAVALAEEGPPPFPLVFLSPPKFTAKPPRISQYTALT